ncbi:hypothetical protein H4219_003150 [Mycoemilia scoparia]|uniref:DUF221-domain-containing protein n=1 Tax=Mycoemilia scoparia TaxID=417184 RepID=A0A9W8A4Y8_9FUNG|nr:hypothetical protein H4219_003150 [Mycoemilia scoparia]
MTNVLEGMFTDAKQVNDQTMNIIGLLYQAGISTAVGAGAFIFFCLMRPNNGAVYARRFKGNPAKKFPPKIKKGIFSWVPILWKANDESMLPIIGIDALFLLRYLRMMMILLTFMSIFGLAVILPINYAKGNLDGITGKPKDFLVWYISLKHVNIPKYFSIHVAFAYLFSIGVMYLIWRETKTLIKYRQVYYSSDAYQRTLRARTLMLTRVPQELQSDQSLGTYMFEKCGSNYPTEVSIARKLGKLPELVQKHEKTVAKLERILAKWLDSPSALTKPRPQIKVKGQMVDAIEHYAGVIEVLEYGINAAREEITTFHPAGVGFVSFDKPLRAHQAKRELHRHVRPMRVTFAPDPKDIIWSNAQMTVGARRSRMWIGRIISIVFTFVAFVPLSALTFISNIDNITSIIPDTKPFFAQHQTLTYIWQNTITPLILVVYYIIVPYVFRYISRYQGIPTNTAVERSVLKKMYAFYIISNIVVFTIGNTIVEFINNDNKDETLRLLPATVINNINLKNPFWTSYVSLKGLTAMAELAQVLSFLMIFIRRYTRKVTPRELKKLTYPPDIDFAPVYALYLWIFTICMIYSVYSPLILGFGLVSFVLAYWAFKYVTMYVYETRFETAGEMVRNVLNRMFVALIFFQVYLLVGLKTRLDDFGSLVPIYTYTMIPLPAATLAFGIWLNFWARPKIQYMDATIENETQPSIIDKLNESETVGDRFIHPIFSQKLATPLVHHSVRHLLPQVYSGRISYEDEFDDYGTGKSGLKSTLSMRTSGAATSTPMSTLKPGAYGQSISRQSRVSSGSTLEGNKSNGMGLYEMPIAHDKIDYQPLSRSGSHSRFGSPSDYIDDLGLSTNEMTRSSTQNSRSNLLSRSISNSSMGKGNIYDHPVVTPKIPLSRLGNQPPTSSGAERAMNHHPWEDQNVYRSNTVNNPYNQRIELHPGIRGGDYTDAPPPLSHAQTYNYSTSPRYPRPPPPPNQMDPTGPSHPPQDDYISRYGQHQSRRPQIPTPRYGPYEYDDGAGGPPLYSNDHTYSPQHGNPQNQRRNVPRWD